MQKLIFVLSLVMFMAMNIQESYTGCAQPLCSGYASWYADTTIAILLPVRLYIFGFPLLHVGKHACVSSRSPWKLNYPCQSSVPRNRRRMHDLTFFP